MKLFSILIALTCTSAAKAFAPSVVSSPIKNQMITRAASASNPLRSLQMASSSDSNKSPFDFLSELFPTNNGKEVKEAPKKNPDVIIDPDYNIAIAFAAVGILIVLLTQASIYGFVQGGITLLFASFLAVQANRIRFVFDETSFELKIGGDDLKSSGDNIVVGGENRWTYDSFVNYDFFPSRGLPILVYFKENQTPEDKWSTGPGQFDKKGGGQIHFFPAIANVEQLKEQFAIRGCAKVQERE